MPCAWYCVLCHPENGYFDVGDVCDCGHLCVTSSLVYICGPNLGVLICIVGISFSNVRCTWWSGFPEIKFLFRSIVDVTLPDCVCCTMFTRTRIIVCPASFPVLLPKFGIGSSIRVLGAELRKFQCARCSLPAQV